MNSTLDTAERTGTVEQTQLMEWTETGDKNRSE